MSAEAQGDGNPFWQFSLALYARDGVAPACLRLQDRDGLDVNLLLYCCWAARRGALLDEDLLSQLEAQASVWRTQVVAPLRAVRRALKSGVAPVGMSESEPLREAVKRLELDAEYLLQQALWRAFPLPADVDKAAPAVLALGNMKRYAGISGVAVTETLLADLGRIADAVSAFSAF